MKTAEEIYNKAIEESGPFDASIDIVINAMEAYADQFRTDIDLSATGPKYVRLDNTGVFDITASYRVGDKVMLNGYEMQITGTCESGKHPLPPAPKQV